MNVFKIFRDDIKRLIKNPIAIVVIIGVAALPSLYAWFNIIANWDPYGSTGNIPFAVVNEDKGTNFEGLELNLGSQVEQSLKNNDKMGWTFTDREEALEGTKSGKYYAAILIPESFSEDTVSILSEKPVQPTITYYTNGKSNAIAQKITNTGVTTVQGQVNETFLKTIAEQLEQVILAGGSSLDEHNISSRITENLNRVNESMTSISDALKAFDSTVTAFQSMNDTVQAAVPGMISQIDMAVNSLNAAKGRAEALKENAGMITGGASSVYSDIQAQIAGLDTLMDRLQGIADTMENIHNQIDIEHSGLLEEQKEAIRREIKKAMESFDNNQISQIKSEIQSNINNIQNQVQEVIRISIHSAAADIDGTAQMLIGSLEAVKTNIQTAGEVLRQLSDSLTLTGTAFRNTISLIEDMQKTLTENIDKLSGLSNSEALNQIMGMMSDNSDYISSFMSAPVELETIDVFPVENYGSAMTPFYSVLAIWVGGIVLVAVIKTNVKDKSAYKNIKPYQEYLGRYLFFLAMAVIQAVIICLGDLFFLKIQCESVLPFVFTGIVCAFVFSLIIFTITISFGDIGKAVCVILLVIQLGGGGGTFPIEVTPDFFQTLYPLLPFTHAINAMRECIAGMYGMNYVEDICCLLVYVPFMLVLGLCLRNPLIKANEFFERKLHDTEMM